MPGNVRSNLDIAVFALSRLGGATNKISTEEIASEAFKLAPDRFSWVLEKFKDWPDKEVARIALEDAAKAKNGSLVEGKYARDISKDGWILTPAGVRWLAKHEKHIASALGERSRQVSQLSPTEVKRLRAKLRREQAFQVYSASGSLEGVSPYMFTDMLQCSPDAPPDLIRFKFNRLQTQAELAQDIELLTFLQACEARFEGLFEDILEVADDQEV